MRSTSTARSPRGSAVTVVGLAEDFPPELPPGVRHVLLDATDPLAREWSVTVLGPKGGATLVAVDQESLDPHARTIEEGRRFRGAWSFNRSDAYAQILRLRAQLRLARGTADRIDAVLRAVLDEPEPMRQDWWEVPLRFLGDRMDGLLRERAAAVAELEALREDEAERDPRTGLYTAAFLERWTRGLGAGTLPIGLVLLRVFGVAELRGQYGLRAEHRRAAGPSRRASTSCCTPPTGWCGSSVAMRALSASFSFRAAAAMAFTASNSSRPTKSAPPIHSMNFSRALASASRPIPANVPARPFIIFTMSSNILFSDCIGSVPSAWK